jgi:hypothetical protein
MQARAGSAAALGIARECAANELEITVETGGAAMYGADERALAAADHAVSYFSSAQAQLGTKKNASARIK